MILLQRPSPPPDFEDRIKTARDTIQVIIDSGKRPDSKSFKSRWSEFKDGFEQVHRGKCGYCEVDHAAGGWLEVEHYRPKTELKELPPLVTAPPDQVREPSERGGPHRVSETGYWWLAYAWENWLLACEKCNGWFKGNLFPIERAESTARPAPTPGCETSEVALLLNPFGAIDPEEHLEFTREGLVRPRHGSLYGAETIRTCGLNREPLVRKRRERASLLMALLRQYREARTDAEQEKVLDEILEEGRADRPFAAVARALIREWFDCRWAELMS